MHYTTTTSRPDDLVTPNFVIVGCALMKTTRPTFDTEPVCLSEIGSSVLKATASGPRGGGGNNSSSQYDDDSSSGHTRQSKNGDGH